MMELYAWKFMIPPDKWTKLPDSDNEVAGQLAVAISATEDGARAIIKRRFAETGSDSRWLAVANVARLPLQEGTFVCSAEV